MTNTWSKMPADDRCLGIVETDSVPSGFAACDAVMKGAEVEVLVARTISPARYLLVFEAEVEACNRSRDAAQQRVPSHIVGTLLLPNPHPQLIEVLGGPRSADDLDAIAIVETASITSICAALDAAAKAAEVEVLELHLAMGLDGHGYFVMSGEISALEAALEAANFEASARQSLRDSTLIARPDAELLARLRQPQSPFRAF